MKRLYSLAILMLTAVGTIFGANVKVEMNNESTTMTLAKKGSTENVEVGEPEKNVYTFSAEPGVYVLTGIASNGNKNGTIELTVSDEAEQTFKVITNTVYATNKGWTVDEDYTVVVTLTSREGKVQNITVGDSKTAGRKTFLAFEGHSYYAELIPSEAHAKEGYMTLLRSGTLNFNVNVSGAIPMGADYVVTVPNDAQFQLGIKFTHFTEFKSVEPTKVVVEGDVKTLTYHLANAQCYNYRTWKAGGLTQAGYFYMNSDATKCPTLAFTKADYEAFGVKTINHDVKSNQGYETGDIFVNINERGHLRMKVGEEFYAHAMRTWELTDNSTNNYFFEPDFHYTVIDVNGNPSTGVITIDNANTNTNPWSKIKAIGNGTAIVLVTYDAIGLNYYNNGKKDKHPYLGGEYWGAIWPENTAAYVVTVGDANSAIDPNMVINEKYNLDTKKNAGKYVDAEHDVFYYLDTEAGAKYTFTPTGVKTVEMARPVIGAQMATYKGFSAEGVTKNEDGSYTLLLKEGRQIVRLIDEAGNAVYQVLTAKPCHREIENATREGSKIFQPGDKVKIQYSGLRHPANKLAGIYNMSAYVTYNGIPNGSALILGSGQYTFGSAASAQAVTIEIPKNQNVEESPELVMNEGVIQVNGFGDPIGNHRIIDRIGGRSPNFTAIAHKTYFGMIPDVRIAVSALKNFVIKTECNAADAEITLSFNGNALTAESNGEYTGTYGTYSVIAKAKGYRYYTGTFSIGDEAEGVQTFKIDMVKAEEGVWDGETLTEPKAENDVYQITTGAELAWFAKHINGGNYTKNAVLVKDIDLGDFPWTPVGGNTTAKAFQGSFDGTSHTVKGLYINATTAFQGLFGYVNNATIANLAVEGKVTSTNNNVAGVVAYANGNTNITRCINRATVAGKQYVAGIVGNAAGNTAVDRCQNLADITATSSMAAGITPTVGTANGKVTNCFNSGTISGAGTVGTLVGTSNANSVVENNLNTGKAVLTGTMTTSGNVRAVTSDANKIKNNYVTEHFNNGKNYETVVTSEQLASGEVAVLLGEAWGQNLGKDNLPVIDGMKVYKTEDGYTNNNPAYADLINFEDVNLNGAQYYNGADEAGLFAASGYSFMNYYDKTYNSWYGFAVSATTGTDYTGWGTPSEFNSCVGGGMESKQFAVGYYSEYSYTNEGQGPAIFAEKAFKPEYVYVTNAAYSYKTMLNGDSYAKKFDATDYLLLKIIGRTNEGKETGHVDFYLAKDGKIVNEWTKVDLTPLGAVDYVDFSMDSSDKGAYGINTPTYFCLDNMKSELTNDTPSGIDNIETDVENVTVVAIYTIDGIKVDRIQPGINILKMSDGTSRKYMFRR